ncbi:MAG: hypothetical protein O7F08_13475 [Deltaproteobacteria bacterium]|nr:hypothetical protein [Deltaproteobacteria bacterium]
MSTRLREAAIRHLRAQGTTSADGSVRRLTMDIEVGGRIEMVTLSLRDDELQRVSSDGQNDGPYVIAALEFVAGLEQRDDSQSPGAGAVMSRRQLESPQSNELADALDELLIAVTRVGIDKARYAPSVDAALGRVVEVAPQPTPPGLGRFIGRLRQEVLSGQPRRAARILDGSARLADALRVEIPTEASEERIRAWLGPRPGSVRELELLYDRTMIEVGREWLAGIDRASVERRYLIDLTSGAIYREDRPRQASASLGPCPRQMHVGLAEVEHGPAPQRIRVRQYEVRPEVPGESWDRLYQVARRSFAQLTETYRRAVQVYPTLAEPFALIAPYRIEHGDGFVAIDSEGHQLALERTERRGSVLAFYDLLNQGLEPAWLAGRLTDMGATLCISPFAFATRNRDYVRL